MIKARLGGPYGATFLSVPFSVFFNGTDRPVRHSKNAVLPLYRAVFSVNGTAFSAQYGTEKSTEERVSAKSTDDGLDI